MGRTEASKGLAPPAIRKDQRAKHAKVTINQVIPKILASNPRAREGAGTAVLVVDPPKRGRNEVFAQPSTKKKTGVSQCDEGNASGLKLKLLMTDAISAAASLRRVNIDSPANSFSNRVSKVGILNMASPLRPGGGVLNGAQSQEEFLCLRTTLLPSLKEEFYRLPEVGGILTKEVLVFRDGDGMDLPKSDRFFVDVVSAGMLRFPEVHQYACKQSLEETVNLEGSRYVAEDTKEQIDDMDGEGWLDTSDTDIASEGPQHMEGQKFRNVTEDNNESSSDADSEQPDQVTRTTYTHDKDRQLVVQKMRAILRIFQSSGATRLVLGAWGCGAYGNPLEEIAQAWRRVLVGTKRTSESWTGIEEVVFAINETKLAEAFQREFGEGLETVDVHEEAVQSEDDSVQQLDDSQELTAKIADMELQRSQIRNPESQAQMDKILHDLKETLTNHVR